MIVLSTHGPIHSNDSPLSVPTNTSELQILNMTRRACKIEIHQLKWTLMNCTRAREAIFYFETKKCNFTHPIDVLEAQSAQ